MRADRLLKLLIHLQSSANVRAEGLASELEVSVRTVYRDMEALQRIGVPVVSLAGPGGGYSVLPGYRTVLSGFTHEEIGALLTAAGAGDLSDLGMADLLSGALSKLAAYANTAAAVMSIDPRHLLLDGSPWRAEGQQGILSALLEALTTQREVVIETTDLPAAARRERRVQPLGIVHKQDRWYLVYHAGTHRVMPLRSIVAVSHTTRRAAPEPSFDLKAFWSEWCKDKERQRGRYRVRIAVQQRIAETVRMYLDGGSAALLSGPEPAAMERRHEDEEIITVGFASFEDARAALLGLGGAARVLAPDELRRSLVDFAMQSALANSDAACTTHDSSRV